MADACGSFYEFSMMAGNTEKMDECMGMPGGGTHRVGPGQVTDDSELAMHLMLGLIDSNAQKKRASDDNVMNLDKIAQ